MRCGSKKQINHVRTLRVRRTRGQMSVELAVCIPVILAVVGVSLNVLGYMNVCSRFDRVAADAVRSQATSPGYGEEGSLLAASRVEGVIEAAFNGEGVNGFDLDFSVSTTQIGGFGSATNTDEGIGFSMLSRLERYDCALTYHPWPFSEIVFLQFFELTHTRSYVVDPYRPGVLL